MNVNASAPYVSVHEPLLYSRKNRLIKRQLVDLRYSLCLRGEWLSLSVSLSVSFPLCLPVFLSTVVLSCFDTTRLSLSVSFYPRRLSPSSSYRSVSTSWFTSVHRCQLSRIIIHSERMWFPFQITKYGASAHCTPYISFGWSLFSFLPWFRAWFRSRRSFQESTFGRKLAITYYTRIIPILSRSFCYLLYIFITTIYKSFVLINLTNKLIYYKYFSREFCHSFDDISLIFRAINFL